MDNHLTDSIRYTIRPSSLGTVLVARTGRGICALLIGDNRWELERDLARRFADCELVRDDAALATTAAAALHLVEAPDTEDGDGGPPLDLRGTPFQQKVWESLRQIPPGHPITYTELAQRLGRPRSVRAVAQACAANPVAIIVPCHRVVRRDGGLAGYRWGLERKRMLLDRETQRAVVAIQ